MANHQDANYFLNLIRTGQYPELFNLLDKHHLPKLSGSQLTTYHNLKSEFINGTNDIRYSKRLSNFVTGEVFRAISDQKDSSNDVPSEKSTLSFAFSNMIISMPVVIFGVLVIYLNMFTLSDSQNTLSKEEKIIELEGSVLKENGAPVIGAKIEISGKAWFSSADSTGNFLLKIRGKDKQIFTLKITHQNYADYTKKVMVNFNDSTAFQALSPVVLKQVSDTNSQNILKTKQKNITNADDSSSNNTENRTFYYVLFFSSLSLLLIVIFLVIRNYRMHKKLLKKQQKIDNLLEEPEPITLSKMLEWQEQERKLIAKDLDNKISSLLSVIRFHVSSLENIPGVKGLLQYQAAIKSLDDAQSMVLEVSNNIDSSVLRKFGLIPALLELKESIVQTNSLKIELIYTGFENQRLSTNYESQVYRIVQELVSNVIEHANAQQLEIQLIWKEGNLHISAKDDGIGFNVQKLSRSKGTVLKSITSRVRGLHGYVTIDSAEGRGTTIMIDLPLVNESPLFSKIAEYQSISENKIKRDKLNELAMYEWQVKITYPSTRIKASESFYFLSLFSIALSQIEGVEIYVINWGKGSLWVQLKVLFKNKEAKNETTQELEEARKQAIIEGTNESKSNSSNILEFLKAFIQKNWIKNVAKDAGAAVGNRIFGKGHATTRKIKEDIKTLEVQREKLKKEIELHPLNQKKQEQEIKKVELEIKEKEIELQRKEGDLEGKKSIDYDKRKQELELEAMDLENQKKKLELTAMQVNLASELLKNGFTTQQANYKIEMNGQVFIRRENNQLIEGVEMKIIDDNGKTNKDNVQ